VTVTATASSTGDHGYTRTLPSSAESVEMARRLVRMAMDAWGLDDLTDSGALLMSELVTNAVKHARSRAVRVTVTRLGQDRVRIAVVDKSRELPVRQSPAENEVGGRGLIIVEALSDRWGIDPLAWGKRVWCELTSKEER
jgi:serine/threonine-protein kinase RsbW